MITAVATVLYWAASPQARPAPVSRSGENSLDSVQQPAAGTVPFSQLMTEGDLRSAIERWRVGTERLYLDEYEKKLSIRLEAEASALLVNEYVKRNLNTVFLQNRNLSRFIIRRDLRVVLNASLVDGIRTRYETFALFIMSASADVAITMNNGHCLPHLNPSKQGVCRQSSREAQAVAGRDVELRCTKRTISGTVCREQKQWRCRRPSMHLASSKT